MMDPTAAAYQGLPEVDKAFYDKLRISKRAVTQDFTIPIRTGQAWKVSYIPSSLLSVDSCWKYLQNFNCGRSASRRFESLESK
jgi:hypothetical protein